MKHVHIGRTSFIEGGTNFFLQPYEGGYISESVMKWVHAISHPSSRLTCKEPKQRCSLPQIGALMWVMLSGKCHAYSDLELKDTV